MRNLNKKKLVFLIFLGIDLAIILVASANIDATEILSEEANNNAEMTPQSSGITYKDV